MSISPADTAVTTRPAAPATAPINQAAPASAEVAVFWICVVWAIGGLIVANILGAFRRRSIVGPVRVSSAPAATSLLVILISTYILVPTIGLRLGRESGASEEIKSLVLNVAIYAAMCVTIFIASGPENIRKLGFSPRGISRGVGGGGATLFAVYPLVQLTGKLVEVLAPMLHLHEPEAHPLLQFLGREHAFWWKFLAVLSAVVVAPVAEELLFRGLLQTILGRYFADLAWFYQTPRVNDANPADEGPYVAPNVLSYYSAPVTEPLNPGAGARWMAVLVTAALFAAVHDSVVFFLPLFVLAIALGYVYERTGNIWFNITTHALFNAGQILFFVALPK